MRIVMLLVLLILPFFMASAQYSSGGERLANPPRKGTLTINQDDRLEELVKRHARVNLDQGGIQGYRIRIFSQSGQGARNNATSARAEFFNKYPDIESYIDYDAPTWRIYVGDFRTRSEALKVQRTLRRDYPNSFIVAGSINLPPLD